MAYVLASVAQNTSKQGQPFQVACSSVWSEGVWIPEGDLAAESMHASYSSWFPGAPIGVCVLIHKAYARLHLKSCRLFLIPLIRNG